METQIGGKVPSPFLARKNLAEEDARDNSRTITKS